MIGPGILIRVGAFLLAGVFVFGVFEGRVWSLPPSSDGIGYLPFSYERTLQKAGLSTLGLSLGEFQGNLLVGASGSSFLYDIQSGDVIREYESTGTSVTGSWIAGHGDKIAVGAPTRDGSLQLFDSESEQLLETYYGAEVGDRFGYSVASNGTNLFVGAPELRRGSQYYGQGKVEVFDSLGIRRTIYNPEPSMSSTAEESFGYDIDVIGDDLYVGALYDSLGGKVWHMSAESGEVLFEYRNPHGTLGNSNRPQFGVAIDVLDNYLLVGANQSSASGTNASGAAYLFDRSNGGLLHTFFDPIPGVLDNFGYSVALIDNFAVIGAHSDDNGKSEGAVFVFDIASGLHLQTLGTPFESSDFFGVVVQRVGAGWLAVSESTGKVHLYSLVPEPSATVVGAILFGMCPCIVKARPKMRDRRGSTLKQQPADVPFQLV